MFISYTNRHPVENERSVASYNCQCIWPPIASLAAKNNSEMPLKIILFALFITASTAYDKEITISIDAGKNECFFEKIDDGKTMEIEYQVIDGGELDISFTLFDSKGLIIVSDFKKSENIHRHEVRTAGDYRFCFDNSFSTFNRKTVFFELIVEHEGGQDNYGDDQWNDALEGLTPEEYYSMKVQDIMEYIGRLRSSMTKAQQLQEMLRSFEARDRNLAENNFNRVNNWSFCQTIVMVLVGLIQVYMVRSIFETDSRMSKLLRKIKY